VDCDGERDVSEEAPLSIFITYDNFTMKVATAQYRENLVLFFSETATSRDIDRNVLFRR